MGDVSATRTLLLGLEGFVLLAATEHDHELVLLVETTAERDFCRECGVRAGSKGRARTLVRDVPMGERPVVLVWAKRVWRCEQIADDDRLEGVRAVGLDEHNLLRGTFRSPTSWAAAFVDLDSGRLLDVVENRTSAAVSAWFIARGSDWCRQVEMAALDPYEGYGTALRRALPHAQLVTDHFHLIRLANHVVDQIRRRTQQQTLGHRGYRHDPLYRIRKLLLVGDERLDDRARQRIRDAVDEGDPYFEVECAWVATQLLRRVYAAEDLTAANQRLDEFLDWADEVNIEEVSRLVGTVRRWRLRILAYHHRRLSNGRTEAMNLLCKKVKRIAFGFRNFRNYRVRLPLHCGVKWDTPPTVRIRGRHPSLAA